MGSSAMLPDLTLIDLEVNTSTLQILASSFNESGSSIGKYQWTTFKFEKELPIGYQTPLW